MNQSHRMFLDELLETATPSGFEMNGQRRWVEYVDGFADDVWTDDYGNAVAVIEGSSTEVAFAGHCDEVGFMVRNIEGNGDIRMTTIGHPDHTVSRGQHVEIHNSDGIIPGVIGQTPIHLRDQEEEYSDSIADQYIDIGVSDAEKAEKLVERGDPITFNQRISELEGEHIAARGIDNRVGIWAAAEGLRRVSKSDCSVTVYAISTVQEEVGLQGAKMIGFDIAPDAIIAIDVAHATDHSDRTTYDAGIDLGNGPVITRGKENHTELVASIREVADNTGIETQLQPAGNGIVTDADVFYTSRGGIPSLYLGIPNRYMHTPVEMINLSDLDATASLLRDFAKEAHEYEFSVNI
jgi:putative aminopeptidase FrvX